MIGKLIYMKFKGRFGARAARSVLTTNAFLHVMPTIQKHAAYQAKHARLRGTVESVDQTQTARENIPLVSLQYVMQASACSSVEQDFITFQIFGLSA